MNEWKLITEEFPVNKLVLLWLGRNDYRLAKYVTPMTLEASEDWDCEDLDYCEKTDTYYSPNGWYENCPADQEYDCTFMPDSEKIISWLDFERVQS